MSFDGLCSLAMLRYVSLFRLVVSNILTTSFKHKLIINSDNVQLVQKEFYSVDMVQDIALAAREGGEQKESPLTFEFLTFTLGQEEYGIDIQKVQELRGYDTVTHIANAPEFIKGVINLRGVIVPIIDMRIKFNLGMRNYNQLTVVIILNIEGRVTGVVVDSVSDVITLTPEQVKSVPEMGAVLKTDYLIGLGALNERMLILVDIGKLISSVDMRLMEKQVA